MSAPFRLGILGSGKGSNFVALADADELLAEGRFRRDGDGHVRVAPPDARQRARLTFARDLCVAVAGRPAFPCLWTAPWRSRP